MALRFCPPGLALRFHGRAMLWLWLGLVLGATAPPAPAQDPGGKPSVLVTRVDDPITPVIADHLTDLVEEAEREGHQALILELDTPGGLDSAMRDIVQAFLAAQVPVVTHVTPSGARAASAGALIAWSSNVVAMAPGARRSARPPPSISRAARSVTRS